MSEQQQPKEQRCTPDDIEAISQFLDKYKDGELFFYSKKTIRRMVLGDDEGRKPYDIFLSKDNGQIIGIAIVSSKSKTLSLLFVAPEYRSNGIGERLYKIANPKQILVKINAVPYFAMLDTRSRPHPAPMANQGPDEKELYWYERGLRDGAEKARQAREEMAKELSDIIKSEWMCDLAEILYIIEGVSKGKGNPFVKESLRGEREVHK